MGRTYRLCQLISVFLVSAILLLASEALVCHADNSARNILVLNSYHKGLSWTDEAVEGIVETIRKYDADCRVYIEYMDWKNYPTEENRQHIYELLKYKYAEKHIDIIIATDDAALDFALENREDILSGAPVVFCGVNEAGIRKLAEGYSEVTGITEIIDPEGTIKAALHINPDIKAVYVIYDNTESGTSTGKLTVNTIKSIKPDIKIIAMNDKSMEDILSEVSQAEEDSIVLITTYYSDYFGEVTGFEETTRKISEKSAVPVFHLYDFGLGNGAMGGSIISSRLQGERAGNMAVRLLKGEQISQIPVDALKNTRLIFDYEQLAKFNISLDKLPAGSEVINRPFSFYETYKNLVVTAGIIFAFLIAFIFVLVTYLRKISSMKLQLQKNNEELMDSGRMLQEQYNELERVQQDLVSSETRYSLLFEKMLNGFYIGEPVLNDEGKLVDIRFCNANPGFKLQTGLSVEEIIGKTWTEVLGFPNKNLGRYHRILKTGITEQFETHYEKDNKYYLVNAFKVSDNQFGVVFDNISQYKQALKEVSKLNEELEQRVIERTDELQSVVNELEAFTYTVSHDLKSPLRAVDGYSRMVLEDFGQRLGEEASEMIQNIRNICRDMIDMINKLLEYSTTSKAPVTKENIDSGILLRSIFDELASINENRKLELIIETGLPMVSGDKVMLRQAIYNLMSNAVKYTRTREEALIRAGCTITGEEYVFYIKDNGVGFDMKYANKLFGIFQRLHASDEFEGSGIGLVTVKKIINKHGGRVWIEGKPDAGATVYFTLPAE